MNVRFAVTFEFPTRAPVTHRGTVVASQVPTCVARATREAQRVLQPRQWSSMVCALLERLDSTDEPEPEEPEEEEE
jgi:hypothetical protein